MASYDVRDVLNLPNDTPGPRPSKKSKSSAPRPNLKGLAREVQNLGGDNPIAIVPEVSITRKRRFGSRKPAARWDMRPFRNSARHDGSLHLRHWVKQTDEGPRPQPEPLQDGQATEDGTLTTQPKNEMDDSGFAKFNVQVDVPQYSQDQYNSNLTSKDWTKEETDYLFDLARSFDLRWPLIWDRYDFTPTPHEREATGEAADVANPSTAVIPAPKVRTLEDLKSRYYEVAAKMMAVQKPVQYMTQAEFALHEMMANFNPATEAHRKKFAQDALSRSRDEVLEEENLLVEVRRIVARQERLNQDRRELYYRLDYPHSGGQDIASFKSSAGLQTLLQNLMNVDKSKKRRSLLENSGANTPASAHPPNHPGSTPVSDNRRESIAASTNGHRDSVGNSDRPERPSKKGQQPERRKLTEQEEQIYGVQHFDRLPSGPTFRYDRINKILTTKSNAQHSRITNTLAELDIPNRPSMPTRVVVEEMEKLLNQIQVLLDVRKMNDKLDGEIRLEEAKKAEREKAKAPSQPAVPAAGAPANAAGNEDLKKSEEQTTNGVAGTDQAANAQTNGDGEPTTNGTSSNETVTGAPATANPDGKDNIASMKKEESTNDKNGRPASSGGHKRSASVLSSVSDKSAKRQKN
ncbi:hypothetical protein F4778DRAFT_750195 [Xylariomycetidae sp. FL2044]|nr:hypothetical protein F4778DRAFT_750195 [Xylariomycetidae sp. FL2044]